MVSPEQRLGELGINLPSPPIPYGAYVTLLRSGNLLFLSGMLPVENRKPRYVGRFGKDVDIEAGRAALHVATLNSLAVLREHLGSLDRVSRIVRLGIYLASDGEPFDMPKVADAASDLLEAVFGHAAPRLVLGVATIPLNLPVELEVIAEAVP